MIYTALPAVLFARFKFSPKNRRGYGFYIGGNMGKVEICGVDTSSLPKITESQAEIYLSRIALGDNAAREEFIVANIRLVLSVIKRFWAKKVNFDDLFQAGMIGLIKSVDNFDLSVGVKFSTYAVPMIMGEVKRFLKGGNSLRVARSIRDTAYQLLKVRGEMERNGEEDVSVEKVARKAGLALSEAAYALDAISDTVSLYEPVFNKNGDELLLVDQIGDERNTDELWTENVALTSAMSSLKDRERKILYLRYYEGKTQTEISEEVGISQAQVSRLEKNALKEIKSGITV